MTQYPGPSQYVTIIVSDLCGLEATKTGSRMSDLVLQVSAMFLFFVFIFLGRNVNIR